MKSYYHKSVIGSYLIGMLFAIIGFPGLLIIISDYNNSGYYLILFWSSLFTLQKGAKIDFENKKICFFYSYLWIPINNWRNIEDFSNFKILSVNKTYSMSTRGSSSTILYKKVGLDIYDDTLKKYRRIAVAENDEIKHIAEQIQSEFKIERLKNKK